MATDFFESQEQARIMTGRLVFLYILAVIAIVVAVALLTYVVLELGLSSEQPGHQRYEVGWGPSLVAGFVTLCVIGGAMLLRMIQLSKGGSSVALLLGGREVLPSTEDSKEKRLFNVVEEMALASGIAVPRIFILDNEESINAFAAGHSPASAVIGVTQGTLDKLSRDELQGVVAHEFSHIFNGDMNLNLRLIGVLSGIVAIFTFGRILLYSVGRGRRSRDGGTPLLILSLGLMVIGGIGVFFARLIKAAVSRQREYLADASAVQFTRNPDGIGKALLKIRDDQKQSLISSPYAEETSHLFFGSALQLSSVFATHPPLDDRVKRIHPRLLEEEPRPSSPEVEPQKLTPDDQKQKFIKSVAGLTGAGILNSIGDPGTKGIASARDFLASIPQAVREATKTAAGAQAQILALVLYEGGVLEKQKDIISKSGYESLLKDALEIKGLLGEVASGQRLPIIEISLPALRTLSEVDADKFLGLLQEVILADNQYHLLEFTLYTLLAHHLDSKKQSSSKAGQSLSHSQAGSILTSAFVHMNTSNEDDAKKTFNEISFHLKKIGLQGALLEASHCGPSELELALKRLRRLRPRTKRLWTEALIHIILSDQKVTPEEFELFQVVCLTLDVPISQ